MSASLHVCVSHICVFLLIYGGMPPGDVRVCNCVHKALYICECAPVYGFVCKEHRGVHKCFDGSFMGITQQAEPHSSGNKIKLVVKTIDKECPFTEEMEKCCRHLFSGSEVRVTLKRHHIQAPK